MRMLLGLTSAQVEDALADGTEYWRLRAEGDAAHELLVDIIAAGVSKALAVAFGGKGRS